MNTAKINVSFPVRLDTDGNGFSYVDDSRIPASCYGTNGKATKQLKSQLASHLATALDNYSRQSKHMIVCRDNTTGNGHIIICEYNNGFIYHIASGERGYASSCMQSWKTLDDVKTSARQHAESCYEGVLWESSI